MRWVEKRMHATTYKNVMEKEMLPYAEENIPFCFIHYVPIKTPHRSDEVTRSKFLLNSYPHLRS
jgi:hypothetical protein